MRPLSTTAAVLASSALALLLLAYIFVGGGPGHAKSAPHCTSQQALGEVKDELFRRAAAIRGANDATFGAVANYSVVRAGSRLFRRHHPRSDRVTCTGAVVVDLPPGIAAVGGRHSLGANVEYELAPVAERTAKLLMLSKADNIVDLLATVSKAGDQTGQLAGAMTKANRLEPDAVAPVPVASPPPPPGRMAPAPRAELRAPEPLRAESAKEPARRKQAPPRPPAKSPAVTVAKSPPSSAAAPPQATARPSFNCRYARTRGEVAVCSNSELAVLDRQMSSEFYRALAAARPGQGAMLKRSRDRFLHYRDSCRSDACIADAYRGRMREIGEIMAGAW
jgi:hypothetical protein